MLHEFCATGILFVAELALMRHGSDTPNRLRVRRVQYARHLLHRLLTKNYVFFLHNHVTRVPTFKEK